MKTILCMLILGLAPLGWSAERPCLVMVLNEKETGVNTVLAIDENYQLKFFATRLFSTSGDGGARREVGWAALPDMKLIAEGGKKNEQIDPSRVALVVQLSPFSIKATSTNAGYSFAMLREGKLIPIEEVRCNIFDYPDEKGVIAIFFARSVADLPKTIGELSDFRGDRIRKLMADGLASLSLADFNGRSPIPIP